MLKLLRNKKTCLFISIIIAMLSIITLTTTFYVPGLVSSKIEITLVALVATFIIFMALFWGLFGLISSLSMTLFFTLMIMLFKFLEISFSWSIAVVLMLGVMLAVNNCLLLLEKTRMNLHNDWELRKSFAIARDHAFNINLDKNIIVFIIASIIFLINSNDVSTIGAVLVVTSALSFIIITLVNQNLIRLFIMLPFKKNHKWLFGLSYQFNPGNNHNFLSKTKYIKYGMWLLVGLGILLIIIYTSVDASGTSLFQSSSVVQDVHKELIIDGIITIVVAMSIIFIYITIRYRWNFALALLMSLSQDIILLLALFVIMRLTINPLFIAASLVLWTYSAAFSINAFKDLKDKVETHAEVVNKDMLHHNINDLMSKIALRTWSTFFLMLISLLVLWNMGKQDMFTMGTLLGFVIAIASSKCITPVVWARLELFRLKRVEQRVESNFWATHGKEEQIISGINNYRP